MKTRIMLLALVMCLGASVATARTMGILALCYTTPEVAVGLAVAGGSCGSSENPRIHAEMGIDLGNMIGSIIGTVLGLPSDGIGLVASLPGKIMDAITGLWPGSGPDPEPGPSP